VSRPDFTATLDREEGPLRVAVWGELLEAEPDVGLRGGWHPTRVEAAGVAVELSDEDVAHLCQLGDRMVNDRREQAAEDAADARRDS
jgi:hypothetical protein